jgi:hypothetical protein
MRPIHPRDPRRASAPGSVRVLGLQASGLILLTALALQLATGHVRSPEVLATERQTVQELTATPPPQADEAPVRVLAPLTHALEVECELDEESLDPTWPQSSRGLRLRQRLWLPTGERVGPLDRRMWREAVGRPATLRR